jgi:hypothetical protein
MIVKAADVRLNSILPPRSSYVYAQYAGGYHVRQVYDTFRLIEARDYQYNIWK